MTIVSQPVALLGESANYNEMEVDSSKWGRLLLNQASRTSRRLRNTTFRSLRTRRRPRPRCGLDWAALIQETEIQDGIEMDYVAGTGPITFAWIEYFVNQNLGATPIKEYNVNQGDLMYLGCWVSDSRGNPNPSGGFATFEMDDLFPPAIQPASSQFKNQAGGPHTWE